ncbi:MAG TPA: hypothetical protein VFJ57_11955 [Solirubrobacterales bacterium]|nr:hypothetical protein [Solirubrobacterales bacterium]
MAATCLLVALVSTATAQAAQYKMLLCANNVNAGAYGTYTNTASPQNPWGIFDFQNGCGWSSDPAGDSAFVRINENQAAGSAGNGAVGYFYWDTPAFVHFKTAGGWTRQPNAFNDGWRSRFWGVDAYGNRFQILSQGAGLGSTGTFAPHLWPGGTTDFRRFVFELGCVRPAGCDRANFNATDLNTIVFTLEDESNAQISFGSSPMLAGSWVRGAQTVPWNVSDLGSGLRYERVRIDGAERFAVDHWIECNMDTDQATGAYARAFQPCPLGPFAHSYTFDSASLTDGPHELKVCAQDYGQAIGLNATGSESCDQRSVYTDNTAPGAPSGLIVTSSNPNRYLDSFGAQFALPPNQGSPIAKVHYEVLNGAGEVVKPEQVVTVTNPTAITGIEGPAKAGDYRLRLWLEDQVGFTGPAALAPIPHDTTPPAAPQMLAVTAPQTPRSADGFDLRWRNIVDAGAPIAAAHYEVLDAAGKAVVPGTTVTGDNLQALADLDAPDSAGGYQLRLWLSDAEGNVGAPAAAPLAYQCQRSTVRGATVISAALGGAADQTLQQGQGTMLTGSVRSPSVPIAASPVCVFSRVVTDTGRDFLGIAFTDAGGSYRFPIPAGPSREVIATHRDAGRELRAAANLHTVVHPTLRARKTTVYNGESAFFEGEIPGPHNDEVTIVLQVRSGQGWLAFRRYRTRDDGHFEMVYPFRRTTSATEYEMRAQVRETASFPYLEGDSDPLTLRVLPESAKPKKATATNRCAKKKRAGRQRPKRCRKKHRGHDRAAAHH